MNDGEGKELTDSSVDSYRGKLVVTSGKAQGRVFGVHAGNNLIGRWDPDTGSFPEIDLEEIDFDAKVSRKHAVLDCRDGRYTIEDLGSLNGTYINRGPKLKIGTQYRIEPGDELIVGKISLKFEIAD